MTGLVTFYGPALVPTFGEYPAIPLYTRRSFDRALMRTEAMGLVKPSLEWTDEFLDWSTREDQSRARTMRKNGGPFWIRPGEGEDGSSAGASSHWSIFVGPLIGQTSRGHCCFWSLARRPRRRVGWMPCWPTMKTWGYWGRFQEFCWDVCIGIPPTRSTPYRRSLGTEHRDGIFPSSPTLTLATPIP